MVNIVGRTNITKTFCLFISSQRAQRVRRAATADRPRINLYLRKKMLIAWIIKKPKVTKTDAAIIFCLLVKPKFRSLIRVMVISPLTLAHELWLSPEHPQHRLG